MGETKSALTALLLILIALVTLAFLNSPGSGDVDTFSRWGHTLDVNGLVPGYALVHVDYPPLCHTLLWSSAKAARLLHADVFLIFKWSLILFLSLTSFLFWRWSPDLWLTAVLHLALALNSVALGYLDIYFAPTLILSFWALKERRLALFAIAYTVSFLTKWQPLVLLPFLAAYIVAQESGIKQGLWTFVLKVALPMSVIVSTMLLIFRAPLVDAFATAINHKILSGQALNLAWIMTWLLQVTAPSQYGAAVNGQAHYIFNTDPSIVLAPKLLFFLFYMLTLVAFLKSDRGFESLLKFSLIGFLAYYTLNTGVHENHLFLPAILAITLYWVNREHLPLMLYCIAMNIINPLVFLGLYGRGGLGFSRVVRIDITVLLSAFNVIFFLVVWWGTVRTKGALGLGPNTAR